MAFRRVLAAKAYAAEHQSRFIDDVCSLSACSFQISGSARKSSEERLAVVGENVHCDDIEASHQLSALRSVEKPPAA
jgi:hypothetical protein